MKQDDFTEFFEAVNGHAPFEWQRRLLGTVLAQGRWPDMIAAPTGAGKTSAIDVHVFATALTAGQDDIRLPRRLAIVVGRRALVDDQHRHALALANALERPENPAVKEVAERLAALRASEGSPLVTARLRGGTVPSRSWRNEPAACAVLCATPDMWGSRLLFGGYGTSRGTAPCEAGLLAFDSVVLIDEAHLSRQLVTTARRVASLALVAERPLTGVPPLQVTEVTATPPRNHDDAERIVVSVTARDLSEGRLAARLVRPKLVTLVPASDWPRRTGKSIAVIAQAVAGMRSELSAAGIPGTVGCYVNTVSVALAVADALRRAELRVVTVCGQVRPADLDMLTGPDHYPGLLSTDGNSDVDVLVSTQSLEVGADLDLAGIVTELASSPALAQRAGRVNRLGIRPQGPIAVIVPHGTLPAGARSGPYSAAELDDALEWVTSLAASPAGMSPWAVRQSPPPVGEPRRTLYQRPELADAWQWARTSDDLAAVPELELWLSDSLEEETSAGIVVRDALPADPAQAVKLVRHLPPAKWEVFPVPYRTAQAVLTELLDEGRVLIRVRGDEIVPLGRYGNDNADVRPGDVVVADGSAEIVTEAAGDEFSPPVVVAPADNEDGVPAPLRCRASDVLHFQPELRPGSLMLRLEWSPFHDEVAGFGRSLARRVLDGIIEDTEDDNALPRPQAARHLRDSLAARLRALPKGDIPAGLQMIVDAAVDLLGLRIDKSDVFLRQFEDGGARVLVRDRRRAVADEDLRQVLTPAKEAPRLADHQRDVGNRAMGLAEALSFPELAGTLRAAGEHHDDGKQDRRFQVIRLGNKGDGDLLAKSQPGKTIRETEEDQALGGLPACWRHEQRSVVDSWGAVHATPGIDPELALRLIGTSHGHGRLGFPHNSAELSGTADPGEWRDLAADLFNGGSWDELIEATQIRYGVWACAYLEAVLRAADCQISAEGK
jgi:CRISPR-associated endonuclease/helicase Cas3